MFNFITRKLMQAQMKGLPQEQQEMIMKAFEKDPKFFKQMGDEIKQKQKEGRDAQTASMQVMMKYKDKLRKLMMED